MHSEKPSERYQNFGQVLTDLRILAEHTGLEDKDVRYSHQKVMSVMMTYPEEISVSLTDIVDRFTAELKLAGVKVQLGALKSL